jgi:hypothetical protein
MEAIKKIPFKIILWSGLLVGTLDLIAACTDFMLLLVKSGCST